jgi:hypothetical protein
MNELIAIEKIAQWEKLKALVLDSVSSPITKRVYNMALNEFMELFQQAPRGFFKLRAPRDTLRRVRPYPGTARGLFASPGYIQASSRPATPDYLAAHCCIGSGAWKLTRGKKTVTPDIRFRVVSSDPHRHNSRREEALQCQ